MSIELSLVAEGGDAYQRVLDQLASGGRLRWFLRKPHDSWSPELQEAMWIGREYRNAAIRLGMVASLPGLAAALVAIFVSLPAAIVLLLTEVFAMLALGPAYERGLWAMTRTRVERGVKKRGGQAEPNQ
ncbi:MAG: hypothetical protein ACLGH3_08010 [Actinomycetota bacterium]